MVSDDNYFYHVFRGLFKSCEYDIINKKNILKVQASLKALPHGVSLYKTKKKKSQQRNLKSQQDLSKVLVFFVLSSVKWVLRTLRSFIAKFECYLSYNVKKNRR